MHFDLPEGSTPGVALAEDAWLNRSQEPASSPRGGLPFSAETARLGDEP